jgi:hypothetical protein
MYICLYECIYIYIYIYLFVYISGDVDISEILSLGHRINNKIVQKLPDFNQINWYLKNVTKIHIQDICDMTEDIKSNILISDKLYNEKIELINVLNIKNNEQYKNINHKSDNEHKVVGDLEKLLKYEVYTCVYLYICVYIHINFYTYVCIYIYREWWKTSPALLYTYIYIFVCK